MICRSNLIHYNSQIYYSVLLLQICKISYERRSYALAFRRFYGIHSYDKIAEVLEEIRKEFKIDENKLVATVTDNGKLLLLRRFNFPYY